MSGFETSVVERVRLARAAVQSAREAGDEDQALAHGADLQNLERLAAEHGVRLPAQED